jgi:murein DD-endopeptidase MepM/ murein hydrolase activator NlpD
MWPYLRNILAREQVTSTDTSREAHFKRKSPRGVAASAALVSGAIAALSAPVAPGVAAKTFNRAASAGTRGLAVESAMLGAQSQAPGAASRADAGDLPLVSVMHSISNVHMSPVLHSDRHAHAPLVLSLNESVLVTMCRFSPSICASLAPVAHADVWSGRVVVSTGSVGANISLAGERVVNGTRSALSGAAPLIMPVPDAGTYAGQMKGGLHGTWTAIGLPADLAAQLSRILAGRLDVTRPAQAGDYYRVVYEPLAGNRAVQSRRRVTAVEIRFAGRTYRAVWFVAPGRTAGDYYSFNGERLTAEPFGMPLNYVRVRSPFGYRIHPVTGRRLLHTGVDLAAAQDTPVVAAAGGTVQFVGFDRGYGKHVIVRHAWGYTTYYAHLSAFASGLRMGAHVSQGQPLGAVGQTGVATGPHLHFEVCLNNQPTNPLRLTSRFSALPLAGAQRAAFDQVASVARDQLAGLSADMRTASNAPFAVH